MRSLQDISLIEILPSSLLSDEKVRHAAQAIDDELRKVIDAIPRLALLSAVDQLEDAWLDELAYGLHVDFYDSDLPIEQKRLLIKQSDTYHMRKGTAAAIEDLLATIFGDGEVEEWFEYGGQKGYFRVYTNNAGATGAQAQKFLRAVNMAKNLRSRLESIQLRLGGAMNLYVGVALRMGDHLQLTQTQPIVFTADERNLISNTSMTFTSL